MRKNQEESARERKLCPSTARESRGAKPNRVRLRNTRRSGTARSRRRRTASRSGSRSSPSTTSTSCAILQVELLKMQNHVKAEGSARRAALRGARRGRQGRHDQALHGAHQSARCAGRGARETHRPGTHAVVLPALRRAPAGGRRDRPLRPQLVQPRDGRAGHGILHGRGEQALPEGRAPLRADARQGRHPALQVLLLGLEEGATAPLQARTPRRSAKQYKISPVDKQAQDSGTPTRSRSSRC